MSMTLAGRRPVPTTNQGWDDEAAKLLLVDQPLFMVYADHGKNHHAGIEQWTGCRGLDLLGLPNVELYENSGSSPAARELALACYRMKVAIDLGDLNGQSPHRS